MKIQKRDSSGRFTSAQAEARKQLVDRARFPAFSESVKAMDGETITQTLGKKQAEVERKREFNYAKSLAVSLHERHFPECTEWEPCADTLGILTQIDNMTTGWKCEIESNAKHVQTNAEKYAKENAVEFIKAHSKSGGLNATIENVYNVLSKPVDQDRPEWCKVGAWIAYDFGDEPTEFHKIDRIEKWLIYSGTIKITADGIKEYKPARVRSFTAKEAVDLVGKNVVQTASERVLQIESIVLNHGEDVKFSLFGKIDPLHVYSDGLASYFTFEDGSPCGVLEVVR